MRSKKAKLIFDIVFVVVTIAVAFLFVWDYTHTPPDEFWGRKMDWVISVLFFSVALIVELSIYQGIKYFLFETRKSLGRTVLAVVRLLFALIIITGTVACILLIF